MEYVVFLTDKEFESVKEIGSKFNNHFILKLLGLFKIEKGTWFAEVPRTDFCNALAEIQRIGHNKPLCERFMVLGRLQDTEFDQFYQRQRESLSNLRRYIDTI